MSTRKELLAELDILAGKLGLQNSFSQVWKKMQWMSSADKEKLLKWWRWIFLEVEGAFDLLDLDRAGLEEVKIAVKDKDWESAPRHLHKYLRKGEEARLFQHTIAKPLACTVETIRQANSYCRIGSRCILAGTPTSKDVKTEEYRWLWNFHWPHSWRQPYLSFLRFGSVDCIGAAWRKTRRRKYPREIISLVLSNLQHMACTINYPVVEGRKLPWGCSTLDVGGRLGSWVDALFFLLDFPELKLEFIPILLKGLYECGEFLVKDSNAKSPRMNNWALYETSSFLKLALLLPEFRRAKGWRQICIRRLLHSQKVLIRPDGSNVEASLGYHIGYIASYNATIELLKLAKVPFPPSYIKRIEGLYDFAMYLEKPTGGFPGVGDTREEGNFKGILKKGHEMFGREDFLYRATGGRNGVVPKKTSIGFPNAGYYVLRSDWGKKARYLLFNARHYSWHNHLDALSIYVSAFGKDLLVDSGVFSYEGYWRQLTTATCQHNTVEVAGSNQRGADCKTMVWATGPELDYVEASSAAYHHLGIRHRRRALFVKPDYWVICDEIISYSGWRREGLTSRFNFLPGTRLIAEKNYVQTTNESANVFLGFPQREMQDICLEESWTFPTYLERRRRPMLAVNCSRWFDRSSPLLWTTVIYPYRGKNPPSMTVKNVPIETENNKRIAVGARVRHGRVVDTILFSNGRSVVNIPGEGISFTGRVLFVRERAGSILMAQSLDGEEIRWRGKRRRTTSLR